MTLLAYILGYVAVGVVLLLAVWRLQPSPPVAFGVLAAVDLAAAFVLLAGGWPAAAFALAAISSGLALNAWASARRADARRPSRRS